MSKFVSIALIGLLSFGVSLGGPIKKVPKNEIKVHRFEPAPSEHSPLGHGSSKIVMPNRNSGNYALVDSSTNGFGMVVTATRPLFNDPENNDYTLQPTSPFRTGKDIDHALIQLTTCNSDSIVSVVDVGGSHPLRMKIINDDKMLVNYIFQEKENMKPRQKLEKVYIRNGCIYASKVEVLFNEKSIVGKSCIPYVMSKENSINIDNELDFITAEILMNKLV